jgi:hypothetical protein
MPEPNDLQRIEDVNGRELKHAYGGFVCSRANGHRVIVLIDDDFLSMENAYLRQEGVAGFAGGLFEVYMACWPLPSTRAIGYWRLPESRNCEQANNLFLDVRAWLQSIGAEGTGIDIYFLIDAYHGPIGAEGLRGDLVYKRCKVEYPSAKCAFLSVIGMAGDMLLSVIGGHLQGPTELHTDVRSGAIPTFPKTSVVAEFGTRRQLPPNMRKWLGVDAEFRLSSLGSDPIDGSNSVTTSTPNASGSQIRSRLNID